MPGFRKGKVPAQLVIQRVGREAVVEQALRDALPEWYERALLDSGRHPGRRPEARRRRPARRGRGARVHDRGRRAAEGRARRVARGSRSGAPRSRSPTMRSTPSSTACARASPASPRSTAPPRPATLVVIDFAGTIDGEPFEGSDVARLPGRARRRGPAARVRRRAHRRRRGGRARRSRSRFPDDHQPEELAGKTANFEVTVKEVREKNLPELDDDFAAEASEFETLDELRDEIRRADRRGPRAARRGRVPRGRRRRGRRATRSSRSPTTSSTRAPTRCGSGSSASSASRGIDPADVRADAGQGPPRADQRRRGGRRARRCGARRCSPPSPTPRGSRSRDEELIEALGPGEGKNDAREAARPPARDGPRRAAARRGPDAQGRRRSSPSRRSRSRWSGRPPASRSGPRRRAQAESAADAAGGRARASPGKPGELWTPAPSRRRAGALYRLSRR